jgi:aspartate kinase
MAATRVRCCHSNAAFTRLPLTRHRNSPTLPISLNRVDFPTLKKLSLPIGDGSSIRKVSGSGSRNIVRAVLEEKKTEAITEVDEKGITCVMKFGGSSVASAERMKEVADLILTFPEESPVIVLSAMGKTTNNLLLAGEKAVSCGVSNASEIEELSIIKELHIRTVKELNIDPSVILTYLEELEQLLKGIAMMKELTLRTRDYLVSFGECLSTRIFAAYLNTIGVKARQYDAFEIGFITTDDFTNGDILEATYPAVAKRLYDDWMHDPAVPIVTGFLGKGWKTGAVTTLGRGGSDLTATTIGKALGLKEIQVLLQSQSVMFSLQTLHTFCSVWMFVFPLSRCGKMSMVF